MRNKKVKLAFEQLEKELEVLTARQSSETKGGDNGNDCLFQALAFLTGKSYEEISNAYGTFMAASSGIANIPGASGMYMFLGTSTGVDSLYARRFAESLGLVSGDTPHGTSGMSHMGDQSIAFLNNGNGNGHAIVLTGNAGYGDYYYYDPQNGTTGTIAKNDPRIIDTYGYIN